MLIFINIVVVVKNENSSWRRRWQRYKCTEFSDVVSFDVIGKNSLNLSTPQKQQCSKTKIAHIHVQSHGRCQTAQRPQHRNSYYLRFKRTPSHLISCGFARIILEVNYDLVAPFVYFSLLIFLSGGGFVSAQQKNTHLLTGVFVTLEIELLFLPSHLQFGRISILANTIQLATFILMNIFNQFLFAMW